jgi:predicted acyl esterase
MTEKSEVRDEMMIDWDVPIEMDDGIVLRADIFRPIEEGRYPVIMSYGPYGKYLAFQDGYLSCWERMAVDHPDVTTGSTNKYQNWEVCDPEKWVPDGYVLVRVDSRGCGRSLGCIDIWSAREAKDLYNCIEWASEQSWSNGKIGLNGISYYAMNQWQVASLQPPHLTAMCIWEGAADFYRDMGWHGGILCTFAKNWSEMQVYPVQHGVGKRGYRSRMVADWVSGPETLTNEELGANRRDFGEDVFSHPLASDEFWQSRMPDWSKVNVPFLSSANWGGQGLHPRGNFEGFVRAASKEKWLEVHGIEHWTEFYTNYGVELQKRFFGHFLKGEEASWKSQSRVQLQVRHIDKFVMRTENEWPLARTNWTKFYLNAANQSLSTQPANIEKSISYEALGDGITFLTSPLESETEITGPSAAKLFVSSETEDADLFLVLRVFSSDLKEVVFQGALDPHTPVGQGWLRASHRKLDPKLTMECRPYHTHDEIQLLSPGKVYELDIEIWPTCIVVPAGYRIGLSVRGKDYVYPGGSGGRLSNMRNEFTGVGPFLHDDPHDRPPKVFGGKVTLHVGPDQAAYVLLPIIP